MEFRPFTFETASSPAFRFSLSAFPFLLLALFNHHADFIHNREPDKIQVNYAFGQEDEFFIIDIAVDIITEPVFVVQAESLFIDGFDEFVGAFINQGEHMPQR
jgi:hypothetical protein